jgi:hypothetical protein
VIQVDHNGVKPVSLSYILKKQKFLNVKMFKPNFDLWESVTDNYDFIDKKYDAKGAIVGTVFAIAHKLFGMKIKKMYHTRDAYFCSEYVMKLQMDCEISDIENVKKLSIVKDEETFPNAIAPHMLLKYWEESPHFEEVDWGIFCLDQEKYF